MHARRTVLAVLLACAAATPGAARADEPVGQPCEAVTTDHDRDVTDALVVAGPVTGPGTLTCTLQWGADRHAGPDAASTSATGAGVVVVEPRVLAIPSTGDDLYVCTQFTPAGGAPLYWTPSGDGFGRWSTDPSVPCVLDLPGARDVAEILNAWCQVDLCLWPPVDGTIWCGLMAMLQLGVPGVLDIRQDGDAYAAGELLWDCPPYED